MKIVAECYANQCLALELKHYIKVNFKSISKIHIGHNYRLGRDKILKFVEKYATQVDDLIIALIDYEKGISRKFIDYRFKLSELYGSIMFGEHKSRRNIIAIIFDPNIEEALFCKYFSILCENVNYYEKIKSTNACKILKKYLKRKPISSIISMIAELIINYQY